MQHDDLIVFVNSVPHSLTVVLVQLAPHISSIRHIAELICWHRSWYHSCLLLASWWAVCLLAETALRNWLPVIILLAFLATRSLFHPRPTTPTTEHVLQSTIADLILIQSLFSTIPTVSVTSPMLLLRVSASVYLPYLLITHFIPLRVILGIVGTLFLSWRAPWANLVRSTLWRSAWVRWSVYYAWSRLSDQPLPPRTLSLQPTLTTPKPANALRFLFTIYENQRWWMGLDWTAALLPGERPSWCSAVQHVVSPPNAFSLPEPTTVYLSDGRGGRVKRTATWQWEEPEWKVLVRKDGGELNRIEQPLPSGKDETSNGSRLLKAAGKMKESNVSGNGDGESVTQHAHEPNEEDHITTDADGWVYGDNKWEGLNSKGGMGKYTRYRRWTRVAAVAEVVELVEDGPIGIEPPRGSTDMFFPSDQIEEDNVDAPTEEESPLRQRLRRALSKPSGGGSYVVPP
ncbi:hypothetical protein L208DRAFT_1452790 [Tricholoma matsutake]|nr:hypothetical protein L208DRAFT_1452790 [Tricholoma matsutake 945]